MELKEKDMDPTDNSFLREKYLDDLLRKQLKGYTKAELTDRVITLIQEKNKLVRELGAFKLEMASIRTELDFIKSEGEENKHMYETNVDAQLLERWMKISRYYAQINAALLMMF
jgi:hypothetical protein